MRFILYGAGAVGGSLGGLLAQAGRDVVLIARGEHLKALRHNGLTLQTPDAQTRLDIPAVGSPDEVDWRDGDVVLLAMKSQDTEAALRALPPHVSVFCVQNGVANERAALRFFEHVYGVCVMFPTTHLTPGVVAVHCAPLHGVLDLGRYPDGNDGLSERVAEEFRDAGFKASARPDIMRLKYTKLLMNLGNAINAVCGSAPELSRKLREEGEAVLHAAGIAYAPDDETSDLRGDIITVRDAVGQPRPGGSSWQSLARGTGAIEADYLNGEIVLLGRLHGVPAPWNEHARRMANELARNGSAPGSVTQEEWMSKMDL
ncbi:ketopantoate reductase family protein [Allorhizocola rhizosphaerae]|uniref:ketopantoate reductase family protein n=1 Tax=Allorhizocola rhizosphaerae TaxID=1872709 RepID=UPI000E3B7D2C|nr:2-dehydropantoate 2-reductase N-terminal domain-containing protein [Allorhizocola rhizosphaerae]